MKFSHNRDNCENSSIKLYIFLDNFYRIAYQARSNWRTSRFFVKAWVFDEHSRNISEQISSTHVSLLRREKFKMQGKWYCSIIINSGKDSSNRSLHSKIIQTMCQRNYTKVEWFNTVCVVCSVCVRIRSPSNGDQTRITRFRLGTRFGICTVTNGRKKKNNEGKAANGRAHTTHVKNIQSKYEHSR